MTTETRRRPKLDPEQEILERSRRIETRLTTLIIGLGFDTESQKPEFNPGPTNRYCGNLHLPSPHTSLREILTAIPDSFTGGPVDIYVGDDLLATITKR